MARKDRRSAARRARSSEHEQAQIEEHDNPVPVEEFDQERMGIAAKE